MLPKRTKFNYDQTALEMFLIIQSHEAQLSGDAYKTHTFQVFTDPLFKQEVETIRKVLEAKYGKEVSFICTDTESLFQRDDFLSIKRIASRYAISIKDLYTYADGHFAAGMEYGESDDSVEGIEFGANGRLYYRISENTTMDSIRLRRKDIKMAQLFKFGKAHHKKKGAENPELLYAIFKARLDGLTFPVIFESYENGVIGTYEIKNVEQFKSFDSLQRYYNKYQFTVPAT